MGREDQVPAELMATFRAEADEHVEGLTADLLALASGPAPDEERRLVEATFRQVHTLRGAARSVGLTDIERVCKTCESVLSRATHGELVLTADIRSALQAAIDGIAASLADQAGPSMADLVAVVERAASSEPGDVTGSPVRGPAPPATVRDGNIRVTTAKLEALLAGAEDMLLPRLAVGERAAEAAALVDDLNRCRAALARTRGGTPRSEATLEHDLRMVDTKATALLAGLVRDQRRIATAVDVLNEDARRVRMTSASAILDRLARMVRDLAVEQGKDVDWEVAGAGVELDRKVVEAITDPLIHLVRNAVAHGIEPPAQRIRAGKAPRGRLAVSVKTLERGRIEVRVEDDGRGCDPAEARSAAVRARLCSAEEARALTDDEALALLYRSGVSTSPLITDIAGHGLGLAIVKERVDELSGEITLQTHPGAGTAVTLVIPARITAFRGLLVRSAGRPYLLPLDAVDRVLRITRDDIGIAEGRPTIVWRDTAIAVSSLSEVLGVSAPEQPDEDLDERSGVVVRAAGDRVGLLVDEVLGTHELLVKDFSAPLVRVRNVAAAGLLGSGEIVLILRAADLVAEGTRLAGRTPDAVEEPVREACVLVVDDSFTTRTMEKSLLEAAGYRVTTAVDGVDAWSALKNERFDLLVSDVDMPNLDGLGLTARVRQDRDLSDLPVVLVTALESPESKQRGIEVGANAYIVKSSFEQSNLLEVIRRLV